MEFGERLREARVLRKLSQGELADKVGLTQSAISALESGASKKASADNLFVIADALRVSARWLATGLGNMDASAPDQDRQDLIAAIRDAPREQVRALIELLKIRQ